MANSEYRPVAQAPIQKVGGFEAIPEAPMQSQRGKYPSPKNIKFAEIASTANGGIIGQYQSASGLFVTATQRFYVRFTANKVGYATAPDGNKILAVQSGGYSVINYICAVSGNYDLFIDSTATKIEFVAGSTKSVFNTSSLTLNFFGEVVLPGTPSTILNLVVNNCTKLVCSWMNMQTLQAPNATDIDCSVNSLTSVIAPLCQTFNSFSTNTLTELSLPQGLSVNCSYNANLATLTAPQATSINATACKLGVSAIESLLVSLAVTGKTNGSVQLTGSNMAGFSTWTSNAVNARNTLVSRGWTITYKA